MDHVVEEPGLFETLVDGKGPKPGQRIVYVDGGFDLFSSGHIAFLRKVMELEEKLGRQNGWYEPDQTAKRLKGYNEDYSPAYIVAGIHDDDVINHWKGLNYPIMNIFERGLCVLQCRVSLLLDALEKMLTFVLVHPCCHFLCTLHPQRTIPEGDSVGHSRCCLPWTYNIYSVDL
jgi:glycerol-3-phosphate cytidylyltransferase-like family protein